MWRKILKITGWTLFLAAFFAIVGFVEKEQKAILCKGTAISLDYQQSDPFITEGEIQQILKKYLGDSLKNRPLKEISIEGIRNSLISNPFIENVNLFVTVDGLIKLKLIQRKPILRVSNNSGQIYFLSSDGHLIPTKPGCSARVPLANGYIFEPYSAARDLNPSIDPDPEADTKNMSTLQKLFLMARYISNDPFFSAQVEEIYVNKYIEFEIVPKTDGHIIQFGGIDNLEEKFDKLMIFYKEGFRYAGWDKYNILNIKYKNQVVCSKN